MGEQIGPSGPPLLGVRNLSVRLAGATVLKSVDFQLRAGRLVGLIGPNGAGKTTLVEALAGLVPCTTGEIRWGDRPFAGGDRRRRLFYLPDGITPFPDHPAGELLRWMSGAWGRPRAVLEAAIEALDLAPLLSTRMGRLSKGGRKRVLLGLALLAPQPLLLLDEPVDGLDLHQVKRLRAALESLRDEGRTLLLSIHEIALAQRICEEFLLLSEGRLLAAGDLATLRSRAGLSDGGLEEVFLALT